MMHINMIHVGFMGHKTTQYDRINFDSVMSDKNLPGLPAKPRCKLVQVVSANASTATLEHGILG